MKVNNILLAVIFSLLLLSGCKPKQPATQATPEEITSTKSLGLAYLEENKLDKAETEFLKLIDLAPGEVTGYANLGLVYLRMGKYAEAEKWLLKAVEMDPKNPDIQLILAKTYELSDQRDKAIATLEKLLKHSPDHLKSLYALTELYSTSKDKASTDKRMEYTRKLIGIVPGNIVPRLNLIGILIQKGETDKALAQLEELRKVFPEFPKEAKVYFAKTLRALQKKDIKEAGTSFMIFHNYLKVTPVYQAGILKLKGPQGFIGSPVITFDTNKSLAEVSDWKSILAAIHFKDVITSAWEDAPHTPGKREVSPTPLAACDYDGDGDNDLYTGFPTAPSGTYQHFLLNNDWGKFRDVAGEAGISQKGKETSAIFADYDNDGYLDLYIVREGKNILYKNDGKGSFQDVTEKAGVGDEAAGNSSLFFDYDHDGDLDLYLLRPHSNLLYRNNADGTFTDQTKESGLGGGDLNSKDAAFADFDDDGDIDLFVVNSNGTNILFSNQRQGTYKVITQESGLQSDGNSTSVTTGDYNNDGFPDLFVTSSKPGGCTLYRNKGNGHFTVDMGSADLTKYLQQVKAYDASFLDIDNDGYLDLLVTGVATSPEGKGVYMFHNDASGRLFIVPDILPAEITGGRRLVTFDYNEDGDMDVALQDLNGNLHLLRNDGGNNLHYLKMKLVGLRTGSGKNNYYGIGAKVEVRAGNLYQSMVVTSPEVLFGLGFRTKADVIRILWTNGVPQNIFFPKTDQDLVEQQELKGSCPFLYTWDGEKFNFVKDIMWRSALGMPLGIMGEDKTTKYASSAPSVDYIKIPGEMLRPRNHKYELRITDELWESIYFDKVRLIAVDHPDSIDIYVDERFMPAPLPGYRLYQVAEKRFPIAAYDDQGNNVLPLLQKKDDRYVATMEPTQYQGITKMHDLILTLGPVDKDKNLVLFLNGWIFPSDASINASIAQSGNIKLVSPYLQILTPSGEWVTLDKNLSFPMGKDKTIVEDLTGKIPPSVKEVKLRIRTNMEIYWDEIFYTNNDATAPVHTKMIAPTAARLHYRGFSRTYRKGGRYGPHWFDYSEVSPEQKWRDLTGVYTRYGDVLPLLNEADDKYIIKNAGDETIIDFSVDSLPSVPQGWKRDFLIHSVGWVKDGDLNTATGQTVDPLPFHAMSCYPYGPDESYPNDKEHREYMEKYNTRQVTTRDFRRVIADKKK
jgi:Tfp pilus assembly protein PilF